MTNNENTDSSQKARVMLITGFLGAGKTTLLKNILNQDTGPRDTVVIVNEYGAVGIDGSLLSGGESEIIELASGCICCTLAVDLRAQLIQIWDRFSPSRIFIEASGLADPAPIIKLLTNDEMSDRIGSIKTITVLDADCWEMREVMGRIFFNQIDSADLILLNKADLLGGEALDACLDGVRKGWPGVPVITTSHAQVMETSLWEADNIAAAIYPINRGPGRKLESPHEGFESFSFMGRTLDEFAFWDFINNLPFEVFRMKGMVRFKDRPIIINHVGGRTNWINADQDSGTRLAFAGWGFNKEEILDKLKDCILD